MFDGLFGLRKKNSTDNDRSVINPKFSVSEDKCTVGIYVLENSRVVLMESGVGSERTMLRYNGDLDFSSNFDNQPILWDWTSFTNWRDKIDEASRLRNSAKTVVDFQLTVAEFKLFKEALIREPESSSLNPFDDYIHAAVKAIGKTIVLDDSSDDFCCIS